MIGRLYRLGRRRARARAWELLERFTLTDAAGRAVKTYSGGMRRRLDLAGSLVAEPSVLFLDEPTTGLDPRSRVTMWEVIRELVGQGTTLLLTTQYLEEADRLADEIVVIDHGRAIARGDADALKAEVGGERIELIVRDADRVGDAHAILARAAVGPVVLDGQGTGLTAPVQGGPDTLMQVLREFDATGLALLDVGLRRPTLDDVFLALTGQPTDDATDPGTPAASEEVGP